jgi:hypothetical protein
VAKNRAGTAPHHGRRPRRELDQGRSRVRESPGSKIFITSSLGADFESDFDGEDTSSGSGCRRLLLIDFARLASLHADLYHERSADTDKPERERHKQRRPYLRIRCSSISMLKRPSGRGFPDRGLVFQPGRGKF